jgi:hypothetical protein
VRYFFPVTPAINVSGSKKIRALRSDYEETLNVHLGSQTMSLGLVLIIILVTFLLGGFSGRFGGYGYGYGHGGVGAIGVILIILVVLLLLGRI